MPKKQAAEIENDGEVKRPSAFTPDEAIRKIRQILREGDTVFCRHLLDDIRIGRHGVSHQDVLHVLRSGEIISLPEWDENQRNWKYKVEGTDLEAEEELRAITIIIEERFSIFIVTAYWRKNNVLHLWSKNQNQKSGVVSLSRMRTPKRLSRRN